METRLESTLKMKNLQNNVATMLLVGGTGNGKTDFTNVLSVEKVCEILGMSVGETNSTLNHRKIVYSNAEWLLNSLVVAVKISSEIITKEAFEQIFMSSLSEVISEIYSKSKSLPFEEQYLKFTNEFLEKCNSKSNTKATFSYLTEAQQQYLANECTLYLKEIKFLEFYGFSIYNESKNQVDVKENKSKTHLLKLAIQSKIEEKLNTLEKETKQKLLKIIIETNIQLKELYKKYFDEDNISKDGYYYKVIDLDAVEKSQDFITAFFTANSLNENELLSIELLFEDILIFAPIAEDIINLIKSNQLNRLKGPDGNVYISLIDTKGLFHEDLGEDENVAYLQDLLYSFEYEGLILMAPIAGDTNSEKLKTVYLKALKGYKKEVPIFILQNKVDILINNLKTKPNNQRSRLAKGIVRSNLQVADIEMNIEVKNKMFKEEFLNTIKIKSNFVSWVTCSLLNVFEQEEFFEKYGLEQALLTLLNDFTDSLSNRATKFPFSLDFNSDEISYTFTNSGLIEQLLLVRIESDEVQTKIIEPIIKNIADELGKTPHGNSLNALVRRLMQGLGYHSNINESYWVYLRNIFIDFPGNLNNLLTNNKLINALISENTIHFEGGVFKNKQDETKIIELIRTNFNSRNFVANLIYYKIYLLARSTGIGNGETYSNFLKFTHYYINNPRQVIKAYEEAVTKELDRCIKLVFDIYIRYE